MCPIKYLTTRIAHVSKQNCGLCNFADIIHAQTSTYTKEKGKHENALYDHFKRYSCIKICFIWSVKPLGCLI